MKKVCGYDIMFCVIEHRTEKKGGAF
jgi:hypothetical protein